MPELPEVETVRRGLTPLLLNKSVTSVKVHTKQLRYPVPKSRLERQLKGATFVDIRRRAKYLLFDLSVDWMMMAHLGMTGRFQFCSPETERIPHIHLTLGLSDGQELRFIDPRRFGAIDLFRPQDYDEQKFIQTLGPEPLSDEFNGDYLFSICQGRKRPIKNLIMDSAVVVGVGNIYASESLFRSGIHPHRLAGRISRTRINALVHAIKDVLHAAIEVGGTTLRDFLDPSEEAGYFAINLQVYGREGEPCLTCETPLKRSVQQNRSTYYCPKCQR